MVDRSSGGIACYNSPLMWRLLQTLAGLAAGCSLLLLTAGCGAGLIAGALATSGGDDNGNTPIAAPVGPSLVLAETDGPLFHGIPPALLLRSARLTNAGLGNDPELRLELRMAQDERASQQQVILGSNPTPGSDDVSLTFRFATDELLAVIAERDPPRNLPSTEDVPAILELWDDAESPTKLVASTPFLLRRQPTAELVANDPRGISVVRSRELATVRVSNMVDTENVTVRVAVQIPDPANPNDLLAASNVSVVQDPNDPAAKLVTFAMPRYDFSAHAAVEVSGARSGQSIPVLGIYYRPRLASLVNRRSNTDGGGIVTATGQGLTTFDLVTKQFELSRSEVVIQKGMQEVVLTEGSFREPSNPSNLVFVPPPSPDGTPGRALVEVAVTLQPDNVRVSSGSFEIFAYGASNPAFEPRGLGLLHDSIDLAIAPTTDSANDSAWSLITGEDGSAQIVHLQGDGTGSFQRVGPPAPVADPQVRVNRAPQHLAAADLDGDGFVDLLVVESSPVVKGSLSFGSFDPLAPQRVVFTSRPETLGDTTRAVHEYVRTDARDAVILEREDGRLDVFRLLGSGRGESTIDSVDSLVAATPVPPNSSGDLATVIDLDRDGAVDVLSIAIVEPPTNELDAYAEVSVWWGETGELLSFEEKTVDLVRLPGRTWNAVFDRAVALDAHPIGREGRALAVSLQEPVGSVFLHVLPNRGARGRADTASPGAAQLGPAAASISVGSSSSKSFLVQAYPGRCEDALIAWSSEGDAVPPVSTVIENTLGERLDAVNGLFASRAQNRRRDAVYAWSVSAVGSGLEPRLTTLVLDPVVPIGSTPRFNSPVVQTDLPDPVRGLATGLLLGPNQELGFAVMQDGAVRLHANDALGGPRIPLSPTTIDLGSRGLRAAPGTELTTVISPNGDKQLLLFLTEDARLVALDATATPDVKVSTSIDLRTLLPGWSGLVVGGASRIIGSGDVDGDRLYDLVVSVVFEGTSQRGLLLLPGLPAGTGSEPAFPFGTPRPPGTEAQLPFGVPVSLAFGDLAPSAINRDEVVVAFENQDVPRFYGFDEDLGGLALAEADGNNHPFDRGLRPTAVAVYDIDRNGFDDLLVGSSGDNQLHVYLNFVSTASAVPGEVVLSRLFESQEPGALAPGRPDRLLLNDQDGDGIQDVIAAVIPAGGGAQLRLRSMISNGSGGFISSTSIPLERLATTTCASLSAPEDQGRAYVSLADVNDDNLQDLVIAWEGSPQVPPHIRVLFGTHR